MTLRAADRLARVSGFGRAWPAWGLMAVLLCAGLALRDRWSDKPGAEPARNAVPALQPAASAAAADRLDGARASMPAVGGSMATPDAAAVLAHVHEVGEQARRAAPAAPEAVRADVLQARVASDPAAVHADTFGQRIRVRGRLDGVEEGEEGVVVMSLSVSDRPQGLRLVASPTLLERARAWGRAGAPAGEVSLDCLSQGVMMGEWLLVDCRE